METRFWSTVAKNVPIFTHHHFSPTATVLILQHKRSLVVAYSNGELLILTAGRIIEARSGLSRSNFELFFFLNDGRFWQVSTNRLTSVSVLTSPEHTDKPCERLRLLHPCRNSPEFTEALETWEWVTDVAVDFQRASLIASVRRVSNALSRIRSVQDTE